MNLVANSAFVQAVPSHLRGRAFGVAGAALLAGQGVVLLAAGGLAELIGPREAVAVAATACLPVLLLLRSGRGSVAKAQGTELLGRSVT